MSIFVGVFSMSEAKKNPLGSHVKDRKIIKYLTVAVFNTTILDEEVNASIKEGFVPVGELKILTGVNCFIQTMVKYG